MSGKEKELFGAHDQLLGKRQALQEGKRVAPRRDPSRSRRHRPGSAPVSQRRRHRRQRTRAGSDTQSCESIARTERIRATEPKSGWSARQSRLGDPGAGGECGRDATTDRPRNNRPTTVAAAAEPGTIPDHLRCLSVLCDRPVDDCPAKLKIATQTLPDPYREEEIARLQTELLEVRDRISVLHAQVSDLEQAVTQARANLRAIEADLSTIISGIDGQIAVHDAMVRRVERHLCRLTRQPEVTKSVTELTTEIQRSSDEQRQLRDSLAESREWLSSRFQAICHQLLGGARTFGVLIEAKSIRLRVTGADAALGEATSTLAQVLSLDLAALQSALDGFGHHPRLAILDSPREADMEIGIFNRLVGVLAEWHGSRRNAFQLIMTTTTRPRDEQLAAGRDSA